MLTSFTADLGRVREPIEYDALAQALVMEGDREPEEMAAPARATTTGARGCDRRVCHEHLRAHPASSARQAKNLADLMQRPDPVADNGLA